MQAGGEATALLTIVTTATIMTMSKRRNHWSVASAKAELSRVVEEAQKRPQVIERRGKPVAVVVAIDQFEDSSGGARWREFLDTSAEIRELGGAKLAVGRRGGRASPFARA
jgi:prevent-host-death family protein